MINSGAESSRLLQRGGQSCFLSPSTLRLSTPCNEVGGSFLLWRSYGWAQVAPGAGGDKQEWPHQALGLSPRPTHAASAAAICSGHGHHPLPIPGSAGGTVHQKPQGCSVGVTHPHQVWAQHQLLGTWGSTCEPWGDAGDTPAAPSAPFLQTILPAPTCMQPRVRRRNLALLAAFVGKGVLKGKSLWGKEIRQGDHFPPFYLCQHGCMQRTDGIQYPREPITAKSTARAKDGLLST